ncbi:MAG TPA: SRPBCC domain-containing protein [bacterium]|nr:SRPBCC domain-containing protein [bacterium]
MAEGDAGARRFDWTRFDIHFYFDEPPDVIRPRLETSHGLESFFLASAEHLGPDGTARGPEEPARPGDAYRWTWRHGHSIEGSFLEPAEGAEVAFTFGPMRVDVHLVAVEGGTRLALDQSDIDDTEQGHVFGHMNCRICWVFFLANLKSVLATGTDLRHTLPGRANAHEVGFRPPEGE